MSRILLGLDVGGTNIKAVILDGSGRLLRRARWRTALLGTDGSEIVEGLERRTRAFLARENLEPHRLAAMGLACAGLVNREAGRIEESPNLAPWVGVALGEKLSRRLGMAVALENDANALAWGEWRCGAGRGVRNMLCLALGTGVGGGLILDGRLYTGHRGLGAELGHVTIDRSGRLCACGNRGCLEAYAGAASIERATRRALARRRRGWRALAAWLDGAEPSAARLSRAARAGVTLARELYDEVGLALGVAVASYVNIFAPERIVIAGGVSQAGSLILDSCKAETRRRLLDPSAQTLDIRRRALGDDGAAIGAALLAEERRS